MLLTLLLATVIAVTAARASHAATLTQLHHREHDQRRTLWRDHGTITFFSNRPRLARTSAGRRAIRFARAEIGWTRRQLRRTRSEQAAHRRPSLDSSLVPAFTCIHHYEGAWNANTGNGYHGGLQMDWNFMGAYGPEFLARWGAAENWPIWAQLQAAIRAYHSGRGFGPWPRTRTLCGV